jgi:hypothetical protein
LAYLHNTKEQHIEMENKLDHEAIGSYVKAYSSKLLADLFTNKEQLRGNDILDIPVSQVGLFILNNVYQSWALEAEKLKSPYFNYQSEAVTASLQKLMNVLSKNILINRDDIEPLLNTAVRDTLLLIFSPYSYYKELLEQDGVNYDILKATEKFVNVNKEVLSKIIEKLSHIPELINEPDTLLKEVFDTPEELDSSQINAEALQRFAELHPLNASDFYLDIAQEEPALPNHEFIDEDEDEEPGVEKTLNDSFVNNSNETVADTLKSSQGSVTIKSMLSINQKFMFINDLFNENQEDFNKVLDFLESCETKNTAVSFIESNYLKHNIWNPNAPQVKEFMALLDKKFDSQ